MINKVKLFGVRRRVNEIIELLNEEMIDITPLIEDATECVKCLTGTLDILLSTVSSISLRLDVLETWKREQEAWNHGSLTHDNLNINNMDMCITILEGLDERLTGLENYLLGTPVDEENIPDTKTE